MNVSVVPCEFMSWQNVVRLTAKSSWKPQGSLSVVRAPEVYVDAVLGGGGVPRGSGAAPVGGGGGTLYASNGGGPGGGGGGARPSVCIFIGLRSPSSSDIGYVFDGWADR